MAPEPVAPRENPLVPFAMMKRLYAGMLETRLLEERRAKLREKAKRSPFAGQEACRAAVLLGLQATDMVSEVPSSASAAWLRGAALGDLLRDGVKSGQIDAPPPQWPGGLPQIEDLGERLAMALGAALALKSEKHPAVVVVLLDANSATGPLRRSLRIAARMEVAMLFVVLPSGASKARAGSIGAKATRLGVPGIPVDGSDAVALFRVAQESLLRARAGGGPALMEAVPFATRKGKRGPVDPIRAMAETLLRAGACDRDWIAGVGPAFRRSMKAAGARTRS